MVRLFSESPFHYGHLTGTLDSLTPYSSSSVPAPSPRRAQSAVGRSRLPYPPSHDETTFTCSSATAAVYYITTITRVFTLTCTPLSPYLIHVNSSPLLKSHTTTQADMAHLLRYPIFARPVKPSELEFIRSVFDLDAAVRDLEDPSVSVNLTTPFPVATIADQKQQQAQQQREQQQHDGSVGGGEQASVSSATDGGRDAEKDGAGESAGKTTSEAHEASSASATRERLLQKRPRRPRSSIFEAKDEDANELNGMVSASQRSDADIVTDQAGKTPEDTQDKPGDATVPTTPKTDPSSSPYVFVTPKTGLTPGHPKHDDDKDELAPSSSESPPPKRQKLDIKKEQPPQRKSARENKPKGRHTIGSYELKSLRDADAADTEKPKRKPSTLDIGKYELQCLGLGEGVKKRKKTTETGSGKNSKRNKQGKVEVKDELISGPRGGRSGAIERAKKRAEGKK